MLSLYIHIPFCIRKCHYCGFYSTPYHYKTALDYITGLRLEASLYQDRFSAEEFSSVYIGGGTPTSLTEDQLSQVISLLKEHFNISRNAEFTIEANPGTITEQKLDLLLSSGVNRLSIGIQSFSDGILKRLGRLHNAETGEDAVRLARKAGFRNISIDLMYGIPGQGMDQWEETLNKGVELKPEHISAYSLSLDEGSAFKHEVDSGRLLPMDDDRVAQMYECLTGLLSNAGYAHYEISNFSMPGFECSHNMNYWDRGEYIGLGPGAWSFISGKRYRNIADTDEYRRRLGSETSIIEYEDMPDQEQAFAETLMLGLRTRNGVEMERLDICGSRKPELAKLQQSGLLKVTAGRLRLTDRGMLLSNEVATKLSR